MYHFHCLWTLPRFPEGALLALLGVCSQVTNHCGCAGAPLMKIKKKLFNDVGVVEEQGEGLLAAVRVTSRVPSALVFFREIDTFLKCSIY